MLLPMDIFSNESSRSANSVSNVARGQRAAADDLRVLRNAPRHRPGRPQSRAGAAGAAAGVAVGQNHQVPFCWWFTLFGGLFGRLFRYSPAGFWTRALWVEERFLLFWGVMGGDVSDSSSGCYVFVFVKSIFFSKKPWITILEGVEVDFFGAVSTLPAAGGEWNFRASERGGAGERFDGERDKGWTNVRIDNLAMQLWQHHSKCLFGLTIVTLVCLASVILWG